MVPNASSIEQAVVEDSAVMTVPLKRLPVGPKDLTASIELEIPSTFQIEAILKVKDDWQIHLSRGSDSCLLMIRYYVRRQICKIIRTCAFAFEAHVFAKVLS